MYYSHSENENNSEDDTSTIIIEDVSEDDNNTTSSYNSNGENLWVGNDDYIDNNDTYDEIFWQESRHHYEDKIDKQYYLGLCAIISNNDYYTIANTVSVDTFLRNDYIDIIGYLHIYSIFYISRSDQIKLNIIQLHITEDGTYTAIIKTSWIKIFQRLWKKRYQKRKEIFQKRKQLSAIRYREIYGRYPIGLNVLP